MKIPLTKPYWGKKEERAAVSALRTSTGVGDGPWSRKLEKILQKLTGSKYVFPVTSCTHGLELSMAALGIGPADEVIMPSFTMTSTANCVVLRGATPVFADIESKTYNIDPVDIEKKITATTRGIIVVHYAGMPCDMETIQKLATKHNLWIVEDAAHAIGTLYKGKMLGTLGEIGVYSFHGTKNVSCGEGGAVVTNRKDLAEKMEIFRANGTNRNAYLRGDVDKYSWVGMGSSYFLSDILVSIVISQLSHIKTIMQKRNHIASFYTKHLKPYEPLIGLPVIPDNTLPNWHIYAVLFQNGNNANVFRDTLRKVGIEVSMHYVPLHSSLMGKSIGSMYSLPITESISQRLVRLPIYPSLTKKELRYIVTSARKALEALTP